VISDARRPGIVREREGGCMCVSIEVRIVSKQQAIFRASCIFGRNRGHTVCEDTHNREHTMTITTIRTSDTQIQVEQTIYTFANKEDADAFQQCLVDGTVDSCHRDHPAVSTRPVRADESADERADDPNRDSTISPSLGGDTAM
jgi:hypothetical protein